MGQKVNPIGLRVGINRTWDSRWYAAGEQYANILHEDLHIRSYLETRLQQAGVSRKPLGTFTEREIRIDFVRLAPGAKLTPGVANATELSFMYAGAVSHRGSKLDKDTAFGTAPDETPEPLTAVEPSEFLRIRLPTIGAGVGAQAAMALSA